LKVLQKYRSKIFLAAILSIACTLPLGIKFGNIAIICAFFLSLFYIKKKHFFALRLFVVCYPFVFFIIALVSSLYSKELEVGFSRLDRHLLPILITIIFLVYSKVSLNKILSYFSIFITITTLTLSLIFVDRLLGGAPFGQLVFHEYTAPFSQHPVYYALLILVAFLFLIAKVEDKFFWNKSNWQWWIQIVILGVGLILCASKAVIIILILLLFSGCFFYLKEKKSKFIVLSLLTILIFFIYKVEYINTRFFDGISLRSEIITFEPTNDFALKKQFNYNDKQNITDLELRIILAKISLFHLYADNSLLFGYGSGDAQDYLDYYLYSYNLGPNWYQGFNVHNQYLHILLNYGVFVLSLFLWYLIMLFKYAFRSKDYLHIAVLFAFCFVFLFEVSLIRNKGIVLFYFFNLLFLTNNPYFENSHTRNKRNPKLSWWV
jgi:hypothetical protein